MNRAMTIVTEAARQIEAECQGLGSGRQERLKIAIGFSKLIIIPRRRPGRKPKRSLTSAVEDFKAGLRGPQLDPKYIRGFDQMNRYKRESFARRWRDAIRTRIRRERRQHAEEGAHDK